MYYILRTIVIYTASTDMLQAFSIYGVASRCTTSLLAGSPANIAVLMTTN